jgi:hypothetical protein
MALHAGDVLRVLTPGGGGWGAPVVAVRLTQAADAAVAQTLEATAGDPIRQVDDPRIAWCANPPMAAEVRWRTLVPVEHVLSHGS